MEGNLSDGGVPHAALARQPVLIKTTKTAENKNDCSSWNVQLLTDTARTMQRTKSKVRVMGYGMGKETTSYCTVVCCLVQGRGAKLVRD